MLPRPRCMQKMAATFDSPLPGQNEQSVNPDQLGQHATAPLVAAGPSSNVAGEERAERER